MKFWYRSVRRMATPHEHIFLTALGVVGKLEKKYPYCIGEKTFHAQLAPLALLQDLSQSSESKPTRIVALVTQGSETATWPLFNEMAQQTTGLIPERVPISDGRNGREVQTILEDVAALFPDGVWLTLDVTQGFRHFPFILYALALYLQSLKNVTIRGAYYGMLEGFPPNDTESPRPIIDLQPLLKLPEWFYAIRQFRETGSAFAMARLLQPVARAIHEDARKKGDDVPLHKQASWVDAVYTNLETMTYAFEAAMPLELGGAASFLSGALQDGLPEPLRTDLPLSQSLADLICQEMNRFRISSFRQKSNLKLTPELFAQQSNLIDRYLERKQYPLALGLMREWIVSWVLFQMGKSEDWLAYNQRKLAEKRLGLLDSLIRHQDRIDLSEVSIEWGVFWHQLSELRNSLHHHGMRKETFTFPPNALQSVLSFWEKAKTRSLEFPSLGGGSGRLLITAQGLSAGVLFSALANTNPNRCVVICSENTASSIAESTQKANYAGELKTLIVKHPNQYDKAEIAFFQQEAFRWILDADEIAANLTGGTTLMGVAVQQLIERAKTLDRPTRRFVLNDYRTPEEQRSNPYVLGDLVWLDKESEGDRE